MPAEQVQFRALGLRSSVMSRGLLQQQGAWLQVLALLLLLPGPYLGMQVSVSARKS